jgi:hypothetical protein
MSPACNAPVAPKYSSKHMPSSMRLAFDYHLSLINDTSLTAMSFYSDVSIYLIFNLVAKYMK